MQPDRLQLQRFELKYVVPENVAVAARDYVRAYLRLDENGVGNPSFSYPVHSVYLDSPDLALYRQTENGDKNRYKLRIRFYNESAETPIFLEIKRRSDEAISKQRCPVHRSATSLILTGQMPPAALIPSSDIKHITALERFVRHVLELHAQPKAHVAYLREAWISPFDNSVRVTMDRQVRFDAEPTLRLSTTMNRPVQVFGDDVVLEIKYSGRFPVWLSDFTRAFGLTRRSAAKYADGVNLFGAQELRCVTNGAHLALKEVA